MRSNAVDPTKGATPLGEGEWVAFDELLLVVQTILGETIHVMFIYSKCKITMFFANRKDI